MHAFVVSFQMTKNEREICEFEMDFKKSFCWRSNLSNENIILPTPGLKMGMNLRG